MTTVEKQAKLEEYLEKVEEAISEDEDIKALVNKIESGTKTTKGNYGRYMAILQPYAREKAFMLGMSRGLIKAGADSYGVNWAVRLLNGNY